MGRRMQRSFNQKDFNRQAKRDIVRLKKDIEWHKTQNLAAIMELTDATNKCNYNNGATDEKIKQLQYINDVNKKSLMDLAAKSIDFDTRLQNEANHVMSMHRDIEWFTTVMIVLVLILFIFCLINIGVI